MLISDCLRYLFRLQTSPPVPLLGGVRGGSGRVGLLLKTEREGFEPSLKLPLNSISSAAPSTARPPLLIVVTNIHYTP